MDTLLDNLDIFVTGFKNTLLLFAVSAVFALVLGTIIGAMRVSPVPVMRAFGTIYVNFVRNTPLTLVLFFCAFILPYLGVRIDYYPLALIGLTAYTSPFIAEAIRSGINGVPLGQAEAARSIGLGFGQTLGLVVMPQAIRMVIPPLINVFIALTKNTSVAGGFFIKELFASAQDVINIRGDEVFAILISVAVFYLIITITLGRIAAYVEKRVAVLR